MLESLFQLRDHKTDFRTELVAGISTFLTMAYIIFLQPAVLSGELFSQPTGMDFGAVMVATCLSAAFATALMGLYANYPVALAPGMGQNFFFVFSALPFAAAAGAKTPWATALATVFFAGILFLLLSMVGVREKIVDAISPSMKHGIAVGIGLFIAFIGLHNTGLVTSDPGTLVKLNTNLTSPDLILFFFGLVLTSALLVRGIQGSIFIGIVAATGLSALFKWLIPHLPASISAAKVVSGSALMTRFSFADGVFQSPPSLAPTFLKMDLAHALTWSMIPLVIIFLFMDFFDTMGTLIAVGEEAGLLKDNRLVRGNRALMADAAGTIAGAAMGTSTVTSYIESAAGVESGGRTGLTACTVAVLFLFALFFSPIIKMVGSYPPITAPALVVVGTLMFRSVTKIEWGDFSEAMPSFLMILCIPLAYSIGDGMAIGFIAYPVIKLVSGRGREVGWLMYVLAVALVGYFVFLRV